MIWMVLLLYVFSFVDAYETFGNLKSCHFAPVTQEKCVLPQYPEHGSYIVINQTTAGPGDAFDDVSLLQYTKNDDSILEIEYLACVRGVWSREILKRVPGPVQPSAWSYLLNKEGSPGTNTDPESCKLPPYPEHGLYVVIGDASTKPGDELLSASLKYACHEGYDLIGKEHVRCESGTWQDDAPECFDSTERPLFGNEAKVPLTTQNETCQLPEQPVHGRYEVVQYRHIGPHNNYTFLELKYSCHTGYGMSGFSNVHCWYGKWSHVHPTCFGACRLDPIAGVTYKCKIWRTTELTTTYCNRFKPYGAEVLPECYGSHFRSSKPLPLIKCIDGNWNYTPACLPECGRRYYRRVIRQKPDLQLEIAGRAVLRREMPWHVGIYDKNYQPYMQTCGGSIISSEVVLTENTFFVKI